MVDRWLREQTDRVMFTEDQQGALRRVRRNIGRFGGDPDNVTIAGRSASGLSGLAQLVSPRSRGLFQRAMARSGAFASTQQALGASEAAGEALAAKTGCPDQSAERLRHLAVEKLVTKFPPVAIPGLIDGNVLGDSIGIALAAGRFARVPILDGISRDEEPSFTDGLGLAVSGGTFVRVSAPVMTAAGHQRGVASVLEVSLERAVAISGEYPLGADASPDIAFGRLVSDANFACPALQVDRWASGRVPTFAYEFDDQRIPDANQGVADRDCHSRVSAAPRI
jgi:para-nitrobenzyl esterase